MLYQQPNQHPILSTPLLLAAHISNLLAITHNPYRNERDYATRRVKCTVAEAFELEAPIDLECRK